MAHAAISNRSNARQIKAMLFPNYSIVVFFYCSQRPTATNNNISLKRIFTNNNINQNYEFWPNSFVFFSCEEFRYYYYKKSTFLSFSKENLQKILLAPLHLVYKFHINTSRSNYNILLYTFISVYGTITNGFFSSFFFLYVSWLFFIYICIFSFFYFIYL